MSSFRSPTADREPIEKFRASLSDGLLRTRSITGNTLPLHIFEWSQDSQYASETSGPKMAVEIASQDHVAVRVLFAPPDTPMPACIDGMVELFEKHQIPSAFVAESLQHVSQSFSVQNDLDTTNVFFHLLVKDIAVSKGQIVESRTGGESHAERKIRSQANFNWLKPGFVLRIRNERPSSPPQPSRATTSSSDITLTARSAQPAVELFCFGAPGSLGERFQRLKDVITREEILLDPYILLEIVLDEMCKVMDRTAWNVAEVFGNIEEQTLEMAASPSRSQKEPPDFQGLHNIAKHNIYLRENCESALATLGDLRDHHKMATGEQPNPSQEATKQALKYQKTLLQSTQRRLESLDRRVANIIQLSFNIVTQGDSRIMLSESQSMKTIAVMTLIFLPMSTVAGVFGTEFIKVGDGPGNHITVSHDFWLLWLIVTPLTIAVVVVWRLWYRNAKRRFVEQDRRKSERHRWTMLPHTIRGETKDEKNLYSVTTREVSPDAKL
ncbi:hypothetical protein DE146DRAFT_771464, partial [Phaeosphaeria sp. MPI-PUGE-AT-0046c]